MIGLGWIHSSELLPVQRLELQPWVVSPCLSLSPAGFGVEIPRIDKVGEHEPRRWARKGKANQTKQGISPCAGDCWKLINEYFLGLLWRINCCFSTNYPTYSLFILPQAVYSSSAESIGHEWHMNHDIRNVWNESEHELWLIDWIYPQRCQL